MVGCTMTSQIPQTCKMFDALTFPVVQKCIPHISHLLLRNLVQERVGDDVGSIFSRDKASDQRDNSVLFKKYELNRHILSCNL
jgi:hypothetical protein